MQCAVSVLPKIENKLEGFQFSVWLPRKPENFSYIARVFLCTVLLVPLNKVNVNNLMGLCREMHVLGEREESE